MVFRWRRKTRSFVCSVMFDEPSTQCILFSRRTGSCSGPSNGIAATTRARHSIVPSHPYKGSVGLLSCGVRRQNDLFRTQQRMRLTIMLGG